MELVDFGKRSGLKVHRVSMGAMRLPGDQDKAVDLIRYGIEKGMRYIDTSMGYGGSEAKLGKALAGPWRSKVYLSTKWAPWIKKIEERDDASAESVLRHLEASMKRLATDYLDFYQVWNVMNPSNWADAVKPGGFVDGIREAKKRGWVRHLGFTAHEKPENLLKILDGADWCEVLLVTYNMLNASYAPVLAKARSLGIGTIVMNPVGGGKLAEESSVFREIQAQSHTPTAPRLAVRYALSNHDIDTLIVGISKRSDVDDAFAALEQGPLDAASVAAVDAVRERLTRKNVNFCTRCNYCMPCPQEVNIPEVMEAIYNYRFLDFKDHAARQYGNIGKGAWIKGKGGDACIQCGECEPKCTQKLPISEEMAWAEKTLRGRAG